MSSSVSVVIMFWPVESSVSSYVSLKASVSFATTAVSRTQ